MQLSFVRPRAQKQGRHLPHGIVPFTTPSTKDLINPPPTSSVLLLDMTRTQSLRLQGRSPPIQLGPSQATSSSPLHDLAPRRSQRLRKGTSPTRPASAVSRFSIAPKRKRSTTKPAPRSTSAIDNVVDVGQATTVVSVKSHVLPPTPLSTTSSMMDNRRLSIKSHVPPSSTTLLMLDSRRSSMKSRVLPPSTTLLMMNDRRLSSKSAVLLPPAATFPTLESHRTKRNVPASESDH